MREHVEHVRIVLDRLRQADLKLNISKCTWFAQEVLILGHVVSYNRIAMDPRKIEAIRNWKEPTNKKGVHSFLGLCNFYRELHPSNFAKCAAPLYNLLKKDVEFDMSPDCKNSFKELKAILTSDLVVRPPDFTKEFFLNTDASGYAIGAILGQKDEEGKEYVIAYASRLLKNAEKHYSVTEKECLAVVWATKHFRVYLFGKQFFVITDHRSLEWLLTLKDGSERLLRWSCYLQGLDFKIIYRPGRHHTNVDALSRPILAVNVISKKKNEIEDSVEKSLDIFENEPLLFFEKKGKHLPGASANVV